MGVLTRWRNISSSSRRNYSLSSIQRNRRNTSETSLPPFIQTETFSKKFHDNIRDPRYLTEIYYNLGDIVEDSANHINSEDAILEAMFMKITESFLSKDDAGKFFKLVDEDKKGEITLLKSLFWLEDQL